MEVLDKITQYFQLQEFEKVAPLKQFADRLGVKVPHLIIGVTGLALVLIVFEYGSDLIASAIGFLYPAYMSYKALEAGGSESREFKDWLTYWVVYSFLVAMDPVFVMLFSWLNPFFTLFKVGIYISLFHPKTKGASLIYEKFLRDLLKKYEGQIDKGLEKLNQGIDAAAKEAQPHLKNVGQGLKDTGVNLAASHVAKQY